MNTIIQGAGFFLWPLGICSLLAAFIIIERLLALRGVKVVPAELVKLVLEKKFETAATAFPRTTAGRIVDYFNRENPDKDALVAFAKIEVARMERGLFLLDSVIAIAPLIGLLGTVYGLFILFPENGGLPEQAVLTRGVGLALTTTMLGLLIAIPSLFMNNWILRRIDLHSTKLSLIIETLAGTRECEK